MRTVSLPTAPTRRTVYFSDDVAEALCPHDSTADDDARLEAAARVARDALADSGGRRVVCVRINALNLYIHALYADGMLVQTFEDYRQYREAEADHQLAGRESDWDEAEHPEDF